MLMNLIISTFKVKTYLKISLK